MSKFNENSGNHDGKKPGSTISNKTQFQYGVGSVAEKTSVEKEEDDQDQEKSDSSKTPTMTLDAQMETLCQKRGYENLGCINSTGGQGVIYKAYNPSLEEYYAVKLLYSSSEEDRFLSEALIMKKYQKLGAKDICKIVDVQSRDGEIPPAIIMEFIEGMTLHKFRLVQFSKFSKGEQEVASYRMLVSFMRIANDLALGHREGLWHRDLKPANIIVMNPKDPWRIKFKIVDFGIGKNPDKQLTVPLSVFGTPAYMSPEQFGKGDVDNSSDIYSMGLVLFFIVTGEEFYDGVIDTSLEGLPKFYAIYDIMRGYDKDGVLVHSRQERLEIVDENIRPIIRNATVFDVDKRYREMDLMVSAVGVQVDRLQRLNGFPTSETYYDIFESTGVRPMFDDPSYPTSYTQSEVVEENGDSEADPTSSHPSHNGIIDSVPFWVVFILLVIGALGYFGFRYYNWRKTWPKNSATDTTDVASTKEIKKVQPMQPKSSMKVEVAMKPVVVELQPKPMKAMQPIVIKKAVVPVLDFEHFRKKCEKESTLHSLRVKCVRLGVKKIFDSKKRYLVSVQSWMHFCSRTKEHKKFYCIALENQLAATAIFAADQLIGPLKQKCLSEAGKGKFYKENPTALLGCIRSYARDIKNIELATIVVSRLHRTFCVMGPSYKRANRAECLHVLKQKNRLFEKRWKRRSQAK